MAEFRIVECPEGVNVYRRARAGSVEKKMLVRCSFAAINAGMKRYANACAQDAFPFLSAGEREFIISGTTPEEWAALFSNNES